LKAGDAVAPGHAGSKIVGLVGGINLARLEPRVVGAAQGCARSIQRDWKLA
jgi:hypothetical protein